MGRGKRRFALRVVAAVGAIACGLQGTACASALVLRGDYFEHTELGYRIERPGGAWTRASLEGADLVYQAAGGTMSLISRCHTPLADPRTLARHLVVGLRERTLRDEGGVEVDGRPGWFQRYETRLDGEPRVLKSVTTVANGCIFDWVLVVSAESDLLESSFDRWWVSFRVPEAPGDGKAR